MFCVHPPDTESCPGETRWAPYMFFPNASYGQVILFSSSHDYVGMLRLLPWFQHQLFSQESGQQPVLVWKLFWYLAHFYLCDTSQLQWTFCVDSAPLQRTPSWQDIPAPLEHTCTRWKGIHNPWSCGPILSWPYSSQQASCPIEMSCNLDEKLWKFQYQICVILLCLSFEIWLFLI